MLRICFLLVAYGLPFTRGRRDDTTSLDVHAAVGGARKKIGIVKPPPYWTKALRAVRVWLAPAHWLARYWTGFSDKPPPTELAMLLEALTAGHGINLYLHI